MPHRRRIKKNSFGGHFDDLVKHFPEQASKLKMTNERVPKEEGNVHDRRPQDAIHIYTVM